MGVARWESGGSQSGSPHTVVICRVCANAKYNLQIYFNYFLTHTLNICHFNCRGEHKMQLRRGTGSGSEEDPTHNGEYCSCSYPDDANGRRMDGATEMRSEGGYEG